jgi:hypothetical protein
MVRAPLGGPEGELADQLELGALQLPTEQFPGQLVVAVPLGTGFQVRARYLPPLALDPVYAR